MKRLLLYLFVFLSGCQEGDGLYKDIVKNAGKNKSELIRVLDHYSKEPGDSLKLKAAIFLIKNMDDKFSYRGGELTNFFHYCDSISGTVRSAWEYNDAIGGLYKRTGTLVGQPAKIKDMEIISADYLIRNIDEAFSRFNQSGWKDSVDFDDFCEYILPYRIGNESLEEFRSRLYHEYYFKGLERCNMQMAADSILKATAKRGMFLAVYPDYVPDFPVSILEKVKGGSCVESSSLSIYIMRSLGLPVAQDFTPQWPHRAGGHSWGALMIHGDSCVDFEGVNAGSIGGHLLLSSSNRIAKIYRNTFSRQENSLAMVHGDEDIPELFQSPYFKDVSSSYYKGVDIKVLLKPNVHSRKRFAYLCVFNNVSWVPVHWAKINNGVAIFRGMGKNVVYLPAIYQDGQCKAVDYPIKVSADGSVTAIVPRSEVTQELVLKRKYPILDWWDSRTLAVIGGRFQASAKADFSDAITVYTIKDRPEMNYQTTSVDIEKKFRYWRYLAPDSSYGDIAEIEFLDQRDREIHGIPISTSPADPENTKEAAFDKDPLTFFQGFTGNNNWVGMKLDRPQQVRKIKFLCRNDDNFINPSDLYELYYWEHGNWESLGSKVGNDNQFLIYPDVPANALFLLRDHSRGKEERIFTYENGRQIWW